MFPEKDRPGLTPIVVRVMTDALRFDVDAEARRPTTPRPPWSCGFATRMARSCRNSVSSTCCPVRPRSSAAARTGEILFYREADLPPGAYQVESLVYDAVAEKGSGRVSTVVVPGQQSPPLRMSSLVLVSRSEKTPAQTRAAGEKTPAVLLRRPPALSQPR